MAAAITMAGSGLALAGQDAGAHDRVGAGERELERFFWAWVFPVFGLFNVAAWNSLTGEAAVRFRP